MSSPLSTLGNFLWEQKLVIVVSILILATLTGALLLFGEPVGTTPWSYSFF